MITVQEFLYNYQVYVENDNTEFGIYVLHSVSAPFLCVFVCACVLGETSVLQRLTASYSIANSIWSVVTATRAVVFKK